MSGHNKWSKIKHKKAATDAKKSKEFSKLVRDIKVAVQEAGGNADSATVRIAIEKAKSSNMPKNNIERAIKSAQGVGADNLETVVYEMYGPGGVAMIVETITDNKNRTAAEVKKILSDHSLELATKGSATWAFENKDRVWSSKQTIKLSHKDKEMLSKLIEILEDQEDVRCVVTNAL